MANVNFFMSLKMSMPQYGMTWHGFHNGFIMKTFQLHLISTYSISRFLFVDVGCNGRVADGGVWRATTLSAALEAKVANLPPPKALPGDDPTKKIEFALAADDAFPLKHYMMKPYPQRGLTMDQRRFNYRHSRARR